MRQGPGASRPRGCEAFAAEVLLGESSQRYQRLLEYDGADDDLADCDPDSLVRVDLFQLPSGKPVGPPVDQPAV